MARIELKNSIVRLVDGYTNAALVNQPSDAPANGETTLDIDGLTVSGVIPVSTRFSFTASTVRRTVTAQDANAQLDIDVDTSDGGTFTVTIGGQTTSALAFNDDAPTVLAAIVALSNVVSGDFAVALNGTVYTITALATGNFGNIAVVMSAALGSLTNAGSPTQVQTYAGGVTHQVTFTPALATGELPINNDALTFTGRTLSIKIGDGNAQFTENREFIYDLDRGLLDTVREGNQVPLDVSLDFIWEFLTAIDGATTPTISDVLHHRGAAAAWVSSSDDPCEPFALDIEIEHTPPCGGAPVEVTTLPDFRWEALPHSMTDAQVSMTGRCNATEALVLRLE